MISKDEHIKIDETLGHNGRKILELLRFGPAPLLSESLLFTDSHDSWQVRALTTADYSIFTKEEWELRDNLGAGLLHYAAWSGNSFALKMKNSKKGNYLRRQDSHGRNIAHYAAKGGQKEILDWIEQEHPHLMKIITNAGQGLIDAAARACEAETLNQALRLTDNPRALTITPIDQNSNLCITQIYKTINLALDTNYSLASVTLPFKDITGMERQQKAIEKKLARNQQIQLIKMQFIVLLQGHRQTNCILYTKDILPLILPELLPMGVDAQVVYSELYRKVNPKLHAIALVKEEIGRLSPHKERAIGNQTTKRITALKALLPILQSQQAELEIPYWEVQYAASIGGELNADKNQSTNYVKNDFSDATSKTPISRAKSQPMHIGQSSLMNPRPFYSPTTILKNQAPISKTTSHSSFFRPPTFKSTVISLSSSPTTCTKTQHCIDEVKRLFSLEEKKEIFLWRKIERETTPKKIRKKEPATQENLSIFSPPKTQCALFKEREAVLYKEDEESSQNLLGEGTTLSSNLNNV